MSNLRSDEHEADVSELPYRDPSVRIADRVEDLLSRMTLPEKIGQLLQLDGRGDIRAIVEGKLAGSILHVAPADMDSVVDLAARTRLGIPLLVADDVIHGHSFWPGATIFPTQLGMACSWDPSLVEQVARATAVETAATGIHWVFSPVLCIARDLRWGRVDETFGEDPHLIGELGVAMVRGYQGDGLDDRDAVLANAKHFVGYSQTQGGRDASEADLTPRSLRAWFLPPFEQAVRAGCRVVMLGYQAIDGVPITANRWLFNDVLKAEWGFTGTLVTDWDNVGRMVWEQRVCADDAEAAAVAVGAGNDVVMTTPQFFEGAAAAVERGLLEESAFDDPVRRVLRLKFELGLFEDPRRPDIARQQEVISSTEHRDLNLEVARRSLVLLRNDGTLPLAPERALRVGVVGPNADDPHAQLGDWAGASGQVSWMPDGHPRELVETVVDGLRSVAPSSWAVSYARGADIGELVPHPDGDTLPDGQPRMPVMRPAAADTQLIAEAVDLARESDVVVAVVGDDVSLTGEGRSTATLELIGGQQALLRAVLETGTPVVVVLISGKPLVLPDDVVEGAAAVICAFNPGMRGGRALAELLLGQVEPSGRLPISFARHAGQLPVYYNGIRGQHGDRYADLTQEPLFAFGEGLSYTTVDYTDLVVHTRELSAQDTIEAQVTVTNSGDRPVRETIQVYVSDLVTSVTWAERELKSFVQVDLDPGETRVVPIELAASACSIVDARAERIVEPGDFALLVGHSSKNADLLRDEFRIC